MVWTRERVNSTASVVVLIDLFRGWWFQACSADCRLFRRCRSREYQTHLPRRSPWTRPASARIFRWWETSPRSLREGVPHPEVDVHPDPVVMSPSHHATACSIEPRGDTDP